MPRHHAWKGGHKNDGLEESPKKHPLEQHSPSSAAIETSPTTTTTQLPHKTPPYNSNNNQPNNQQHRNGRPASPVKQSHSNSSSSSSGNNGMNQMKLSPPIHGRNRSLSLPEHASESEPLSWYGVAAICLALSILSLILHICVRLGVEWIPADYSGVLTLIAVISAAISVPLTHGLAGIRKHQNEDYHFFQPFAGGYRYVLLQFLGWAVYTAVLLGALYIVMIGARKAAVFVVASVGVGGVIAQVLVLVSLHFYGTASRAAYDRRQRKQRPRQKKKFGKEVSKEKIPVDLNEPQVISALSTSSGKAGMILTILGIILAILLESISRSHDSHEPFSATSHISLQSIVTSSLLLGVPLTHVLTGTKIHPSYALFQPFQGGWAFVLLQALGWSLWVIAAVTSFISIFFALNHQPISGIVGGVGIIGVLSQAMVLLSLKYFDSRLTHSVNRAEKTMETARWIKQSSSRNLLEYVKGEKVAADLREAVDVTKLVRMPSLTRTAPRVDLSQQQLLAAAKYTEGNGEALQELRTGLAKCRRYTYSTARLVQYAQQELIDRGIQSTDDIQQQEQQSNGSSPREPTFLTSLSFSQWKDVISVWIAKFQLWSWNEIYLDLRCSIIVSAMYFVPIIGAFIAFFPFLLLYFFSHIWWVPVIAGLMVFAYAATLGGRPSHTGAKSWDFIRKNTLLWSSFERYFSATVIGVGKIDISQGPMIFAFHPHGIYPLTTFWATRGPSFRSAYPDIEVEVCGASVMFNAPLLREILLWSGGREVSASSIKHALKQNRSILIIPGGQREMLHSAASHSTLTFVTKHKGFIRLAIQQGVPLVPVLSLGETFGLQNVYFPALQSWFLKHTGIGWPVFPYGRWYSPIANHCPITIVVGHPLEVQKIEEPTDEQVDAVHQLYYDAVKRLFEQYKEEAGFPNQTLLFSDH